MRIRLKLVGRLLRLVKIDWTLTTKDISKVVKALDFTKVIEIVDSMNGLVIKNRYIDAKLVTTMLVMKKS